MKKETYHCDACEREVADDSAHVGVRMQVIFTTEQDEGRATDPYFSIETLDICDSCTTMALAGHYLFAVGAQGHNTYSFKYNK